MSKRYWNTLNCLHRLQALHICPQCCIIPSMFNCLMVRCVLWRVNGANLGLAAYRISWRSLWRICFNYQLQRNWSLILQTSNKKKKRTYQVRLIFLWTFCTKGNINSFMKITSWYLIEALLTKYSTYLVETQGTKKKRNQQKTCCNKTKT